MGPGPRLYTALRADVAQLARASACHAEGRGFESHHPLLEAPPRRGFLLLAALVERLVHELVGAGVLRVRDALDAPPVEAPQAVHRLLEERLEAGVLDLV